MTCIFTRFLRTYVIIKLSTPLLVDLNRQEKHNIVLEVVDSLYEKLANELDYHLMDHENFSETNDEFLELFNNMTIQVVKEMNKQLYVQL